MINASGMNEWMQVFSSARFEAALIVIGLVLLVFGIKSKSPFEAAKPQVEVLQSDEVETAEVVVDIEGAVNNPGVYKLPAGSRWSEAIDAAGGLDQDRVNLEKLYKQVNLAAKISDGSKIYIPESDGEIAGTSDDDGLINVNEATVAELETLTGIGEARAKTIIDNRPYQNVDELVTKAKIPKSVVEKFKDKIVSQ
jgi:competence protein ComEA